MPELPDVEAFRRRLAAAGLHREIADVKVPDTTMVEGASVRGLGRALKGVELVATKRHGKHMFAHTGDRWLVLHFGMTGRLEHLGEDDEPPGHIRFELRYADGSRMVLDDQRRLGYVSLTDSIDGYVASNDLGPDALRMREPELREAVSTRRGTLKSALMNQSVLAGIGNVYSDEILFQAKLSPSVRPPDVDRPAYRRLHRQLVRVLTMAADRAADPDRMPRTWLLGHREDGAPCPVATDVSKSTGYPAAGRSAARRAKDDVRA